MIRAVCFDMDGVLVDSERMSLELVLESAALQGCVMTPEQSLRSIGTNVASLTKLLHELFPGRIDAPRFMQDWYELTMQRVRTQGVPLKPGAREVLAALKARGIRLALCTSNVSRVVEEYLALAGLTDFFDAVVTGDQVERGKPDPAVYLLGAAQLGVSPRECAGVEDSFSGVRAVRAAGMRCVMIPDVQPYDDSLADCVDVLLPDLLGLEEALLGDA